MLIKQESKLELGPDTIRAAHQDRVLHACKVKFKQTAEASDTSHDSGSYRPGNVTLHELDRPVPCSYIYSGSSIAVGS